MSNSARKRKSEKENKSKKSFLGGLRKVEMVGIGIIALAAIMYLMSKCNRGEDLPPPSSEAIVQDSSQQKEAPTRPNIQRRYVYVSIDSLQFRNGPHLDSSSIRSLAFGEQLIYLDYSKFEQTIRIAAEEIVTEPWVKVKTKEGKTGWVFGAGVRPYPKKASETTNEEE